jgi:transcriptional regulator with XRE-family HTH domain
MSITRDQLRAARVLLHLQQKQLSTLSKVSVSTIRRFEAGLGIGPVFTDALRRSLEEAGAIFVDGDGNDRMPTGAVGVLLMADEDIPEETLVRIAADRLRVAGDSTAEAEPAAQDDEAPVRADADQPATDHPIDVRTSGKNPNDGTGGETP